MNKSISEKNNTPALRFKKFKETKWTKVKLGDYLIQHNEITTKNNQYPVLTSSQKGIFLQRDYFAGNDVASEDTTGYNVVPRGYFTYRHMSDTLVFKFNINNIVEKGIVSTLYPVFSTNKEICPEFLLHCLNEGREFKKYAILQKQGGSRTYMYYSKLVKMHITVPGIEEQKEIAHFIKYINDWISNLKAQKSRLEVYKRATIQKIFSQEIRFLDSDGKHFPDWQLVKLKEVLSEHGRKSEGTEEVHSVSVHKGVINQIDHLGRSYAAKDTSHYNLVKPGDIIYTKSPTGNFPYGIIKQSLKTDNVIVSPLYGVFSPKSESLGYILDAYFESPKTTGKYLHSLVQKGAKNTINISNSTFLSKTLRLPVSTTEQEKIAAQLKMLNEYIDIKTKHIEKAETWKRGLLQKMFV